nr:sigma-70 family RNA polymerase sigma factor [Actinomycetota bacterium]
MVGLLSLYCGDADVGEEMAQEAIVRVCRDWSKVRQLEAPEAWVWRVAINLTNSHFRRKAAERRVRRRLEGRGSGFLSEQDDASIISIRKVVAALPTRQRTAVVLRFYLDLSVSQTADLMDCAQGTVKALTHKGIAALRARPEFQEDELFDVT